MRDYWLSKLFFDLQNPAAAEEYRAARGKVLDRYPLKPEVRAAVERDDVFYVSRLVNPYLVFYFTCRACRNASCARSASAPEVAKTDQLQIPRRRFIVRRGVRGEGKAPMNCRKWAVSNVLSRDARSRATGGAGGAGRTLASLQEGARAPPLVMAKLVGVYASSHGPMIVRNWQTIAPKWKESLTAGFSELGRRIELARPDVLIEISPDHWVNFFIDNLPSICVGVGEEHDGPPSLAQGFPTRRSRASAAGEPYVESRGKRFRAVGSYRLALDHGFCIPYGKPGWIPPPIVPIITTTLSRRSHGQALLRWGAMLARRRYYPEDLRWRSGNGGLSHSIASRHGRDRRRFPTRLHRPFRVGKATRADRFPERAPAFDRQRRSGNPQLGRSARGRRWARLRADPVRRDPGCIRGVRLRIMEAVKQTPTAVDNRVQNQDSAADKRR